MMDASNDWQTGKNLGERLYYMLQNNLMCDVRLLAGNEETTIDVHKFMLSSASPVFYTMFNGLLAEKGEIKIPDIEPNIFNKILKYIYTDDVEIDFHNITELFYGAEKYMLLDLKEKCNQYLISKINNEHACTVLQYSHELQFDNVKQNTLKYIWKNGTLCLQSKNVSSLSLDCLKLVVQSDELYCSEVDVYKLTVEWGRDRCKRNNLPVTDKNIRKELGNLLYLIRFPIMERQYFTEKISTENILTADEKLEVYQSFDGQSVKNFSNVPRCLQEILVQEIFHKRIPIGMTPDESRDCLDFNMTRNCHLIGIRYYEEHSKFKPGDFLDVKLLQSQNVINSATSKIGSGEKDNLIRFKTPSTILAKEEYRLQLQRYSPFCELMKTSKHLTSMNKGMDCHISDSYVSKSKKVLTGKLHSIVFTA